MSENYEVYINRRTEKVDEKNYPLFAMIYHHSHQSYQNMIADFEAKKKEYKYEDGFFVSCHWGDTLS